ncbi:hypothetical protein DFH27DRAFT_566287 [Peziza echinospora]|nr:hypothetical protein DFH27DRAFT_566287 [Peziza echinospora]
MITYCSFFLRSTYTYVGMIAAALSPFLISHFSFRMSLAMMKFLNLVHVVAVVTFSNANGSIYMCNKITIYRVS